MTRHVLLALAVAANLLTLKAAEEPKKDSAVESMGLAAWRVPPGFVSSADPTNPEGVRKPHKGFVSKKNPHAIQYDAREFLEMSGVLFPEGAEAIYDEGANSLIVRNTQDNLDLIDSLVGWSCNLRSPNIVIEITTFESTIPAEFRKPTSKWPSFTELERLAGAEMQMLDRVSATTKSGNRSVIKNRDGFVSRPKPNAADQPDEKDEETFREGESGTQVEVEPVIGPDGVTIDISLSYQFRLPPRGNKISELSFNSDYVCTEGNPVILQIAQVPGQPDKFLIVVATAKFINAAGWPTQVETP